jgi:hypothetical protein
MAGYYYYQQVIDLQYSYWGSGDFPKKDKNDVMVGKPGPVEA